MDIEGYARRMLEKMSEEEVKDLLAKRIAEIKNWSHDKAMRWLKL